MPPVEHVELSWKNYKLRIVAAVVCLLVGAGTLAYSLASCMGTAPGWTTIEASTGGDASCAGDFTLVYELGAGGGSAASENRTLVSVYSAAATDAYRRFHSTEEFEGVINVCYLNRHPNEVLTVDETLYEAFALLARYGERSVYLGPVYATYNGIFSCQEDWQTADFDPCTNPELAAFFAQVAAFARDPESVDLELLGDGRVRLRVSEAYLAFAAENEFDRFVDFAWLLNAFLADDLAETLAAQGFTHGALSSYDGYIRNLDDRGTGYGLAVSQWVDGAALSAATLQYDGALSLVSLRGYPLTDLERTRFYRFDDGAIRTPYVDVRDGLPKAQGSSVICCAREMGCAETLLNLLPCYVGDSLDTDALWALGGSGIWSICCEGRTLRYNAPDAVFSDVYSGYSLAPVND